MGGFLLFAAALILAATGAGLVALRRASSPVDGMMGVQLLGSGSVAVLILLSVALAQDALVDAALTVAVLAAFAVAALHAARRPRRAASPPEAEGP
ncbi:multiple resistance and pH regulation protein F [Aquabacter sp. CN5-332]|uniref:multiple resistance and pH regulation protein F n=1 Tax=Aquabacter sp. CN5-332 TaxID=3156608 RepID=UPI0032B38596